MGREGRRAPLPDARAVVRRSRLRDIRQQRARHDLRILDSLVSTAHLRAAQRDADPMLADSVPLNPKLRVPWLEQQMRQRHLDMRELLAVMNRCGRCDVSIRDSTVCLRDFGRAIAALHVIEDLRWARAVIVCVNSTVRRSLCRGCPSSCRSSQQGRRDAAIL